MARSEGEERSGAARSHAQRALQREHGEDGEHRTFPGVSGLAHLARQPAEQAQAASVVTWRAGRWRAAAIASTRASSVFSSSTRSGTA
jgi:hypothetical protein